MTERAGIVESSEPSTWVSAFRHPWKVGLAVAVVMVILALVGVGLTTAGRDVAPKYWVSLVPVYGLLCVATAWVRSTHTGNRVMIVRQVFHWVAIAAALALDFTIRGGGVETGLAAGYNALLLLALGCFLAGVHLDWPFALVGLLLTATLVVVVRAEQYLWLMVVAGFVIVGVLFGVMRMSGRGGGCRP